MTETTTKTTPTDGTRGRFSREGETPEPTQEHLLEEFEAERPGRTLEGWVKGQISVLARLVIGAAAVVLLWLEPTVTLIGLGLLAHVLTRRRQPAAA
ncbi:MAG TPA: hypothetical protein VFZ00_04640 [Solirubrobacter sp.]|jgi:hypothetical protein|nr:hypothetical protein [Solirubrobacter sp.]